MGGTAGAQGAAAVPIRDSRGADSQCLAVFMRANLIYLPTVRLLILTPFKMTGPRLSIAPR